ncbi:MAG TPA: pirin family protein, partial [Kofleriaceae bacterium]
MLSPIERKIARRVQLPAPKRGQFGPDHQVVEVLTPERWAEQDPFILLMDDRLDGTLRAGPHPHAGFETVTFPLAGGMESEGGEGRLAPGDVEWTTAGSGIVHGPESTVKGRFRILQLWLTLPKQARWTEPDNQIVRGADVPVRREPGALVRLYSGATGDLVSPTRNRVPVTLVDIRLEPGASVEQRLPS